MTIPDRSRRDAVAVAVEADEAGLRDRRGDLVEAPERSLRRHQRRALLLEDLEDGAPLELRVPGRSGPGEHPLAQDGVQLVIVGHPQPRREELLPGRLHLALDLPLFPAGRRRARRRLDQVMRAHALEPAVEAPLLANQDRVDRRRHVVVDPPRAGPAEEHEGLVVRIEHHLLRLARIGDQERHAAVAKAEMRHLHLGGDAAHQHVLVAPVELVGFARREAQRHEGVGDAGRPLLPPSPGITPHAVVAAAVAFAAEVVEDPRQPQSVPLRPALVGLQHHLQPADERPELRKRLRGPLVGKLRVAGAQDLPHRIAADAALPADLLDPLAMNEVVPSDLRDSLHPNHPPRSLRPPL